MSSAQEFQEIAHCGGKVIFEIRTEGDARSLSVGVSHDRPTPASWFGVYALRDGQPVADMEMGGMGEGSAAPPTADCLPVFIAADRESYFGHWCRAGCDGYWRARVAPARWPLTCPYCGAQRPTYAFRSPAQLSYIRHYVATLLEAFESLEGDGEVVIDMDEIVESASDEPVLDFYSAEVSQQCRFTCESCGAQNDILGHFGFCCCCGGRNNNSLFRTDVSRILAELGSTLPAAEGVKRLVSAYESCGRNYVASLSARIPMTARRAKQARRLRFQNVNRSAKAMVELFDIDPLQGISDEDARFAAMMFSRRHVYEHSAGVADQKYLDESGDQSVRVGQAIREVRENPVRLGPVLLSMMSNIDQGLREIFPPDRTAVALMRPARR